MPIAARAGEEGKLFGSVTAADVAEAIAAQTGIQVDRKDVHLDEPIRSLGTHDVRVHLFPEVEPVLTSRSPPRSRRVRQLTIGHEGRACGPAFVASGLSAGDACRTLRRVPRLEMSEV